MKSQPSSVTVRRPGIFRACRWRAMLLSLVCAAPVGAEDWVLQGVDYVMMDYILSSEGPGTHVIFSEGTVPSQSTIEVPATNSLRPGTLGWSQVPWIVDGTVTWSFPLIVPRIYPEPPTPVPQNTFTVNAAAIFHDPRRVTPPQTLPALNWEVRISSAGYIWGPGPTTPQPWIDPATNPDWRTTYYWYFGGTGPTIRGRHQGSTTGDASLSLANSLTGPMLDASSNIHDTILVEFFTSGGTNDSARYRALYLYPRYWPSTTGIRVDTLSDVDDGNYGEGQQSLREALKRAGESTSGVDIPILVSGTISLDAPLTTTGTNTGVVRLRELAGDVVLDAGGHDYRILRVTAGKRMLISGLEFVNGRSQGDGGAIRNDGDLDLQLCKFRNCFADGNIPGTAGGGAISNHGTLDLQDCVLEENTVTFQGAGTEARGGAIINHGTLNLVRCLLSSNLSQDGGGAIYVSAGNASLRDCLFQDNVGLDASTEPFASTLFIAQGASLVAVNCALTASHRMVRSEGSCILRHCTLFEGRHLLSAGGSGSVAIGHCAIAGALADSLNIDVVVEGAATVTSEGYNAIHSPGISFTKVPTDIIDKPLHIARSSDGSVVLLAYSPCVNAGNRAFNPSSVTPPLYTDVRGRARVVGDAIDIGAVEVSETLLLRLALANLATGDSNNNGIPDLVDAISGIDASLDRSTDPPVEVQPPSAGSPPTASIAVQQTNAIVGGTSVIEARIDERVTEVSATLQTSPDLITWTDRAVYTPQGKGLGYTRTLPNGVTFVEHEKSGYGWFIRESISVPPGSQLFVRMKATELP